MYWHDNDRLDRIFVCGNTSITWSSTWVYVHWAHISGDGLHSVCRGFFFWGITGIGVGAVAIWSVFGRFCSSGASFISSGLPVRQFLRITLCIRCSRMVKVLQGERLPLCEVVLRAYYLRTFVTRFLIFTSEDRLVNV